MPQSGSITATYMSLLGLNEAELRSRLRFFEIGDEDLRRLAELREFGERHTDEIVERFYEHLLGHPDTRAFFPDEATLRHVKRMQATYFRRLFSGKVDLDYVEDRLRVGIAHERIGLGPKWYIGAYRKYLELLLDRMSAELPADEAPMAYRSAQRLVAFDMALAMDAYIAAGKEALQRHQHAIRELSTPVIRVYPGVLLLPLVGTIDSARAQQVMETALMRVVEEQARVLLLDIAGVAVVDTKVADHLIKTTAAIRLLGAETILTGISAEVARTIVQLGLDISSMQTRARLADGIDLALAKVGKTISELRA
jgi:rsbT co-antagonist protein RsbR